MLDGVDRGRFKRRRGQEFPPRSSPGTRGHSGEGRVLPCVSLFFFLLQLLPLSSTFPPPPLPLLHPPQAAVAAQPARVAPGYTGGDGQHGRGRNQPRFLLPLRLHDRGLLHDERAAAQVSEGRGYSAGAGRESEGERGGMGGGMLGSSTRRMYSSSSSGGCWVSGREIWVREGGRTTGPLSPYQGKSWGALGLRPPPCCWVSGRKRDLPHSGLSNLMDLTDLTDLWMLWICRI